MQLMKLVLVKAILDYGLNEILPIFSPFFVRFGKISIQNIPCSAIKQLRVS
jgi:hypothetical protein